MITQIQRTQWKVYALLLFALIVASAMLASELALPNAAAAAPKYTLKQSAQSFRKVSGKATFTLKPNQSGTVTIVVSTSAGKLVSSYSKTVKKNKPTTLVWNGRVTKSNQVGKESNDYAKAGSYTIRITLETSSGEYSRTRKVTLKGSPKPKISSVHTPASVKPSTSSAAHAAKISYRLSASNDVVFQIVNRETDVIVAQKKYRNVTTAKTRTIYWNGQVTNNGSVALASGVQAVAGDVVPAGTYTLYVRSNGASVKRSIKVLPVGVSSVKLTSPSTTVVSGDSVQLNGYVVPRGASNPNLIWTSSDSSKATVDALGKVTALQAQGTVTITAQSLSNPKASKSIALTIVSGSSMAMSGFSVATFVPMSQSYQLKGQVTSSSQIISANLTIADSINGIETSVTALGTSTVFDIKSTLNPMVQFALLSQGKKTITLTATDQLGTKTLYIKTFWIIGPIRYGDFWTQRMSTWVYPLDIKRSGYISSFGAIRDGGARAHAAIDLVQPPGVSPHDKVYAMADGVVQRISNGTYFAGTGAVQIQHSDGSVIWYCEILPKSGLKVGASVKQNQCIGEIMHNTTSVKSAMLHLEAYSGEVDSSGSGIYLYQGSNASTYDNVTPVRFLRRRDLISPMGVVNLPIPPLPRVVAP